MLVATTMEEEHGSAEAEQTTERQDLLAKSGSMLNRQFRADDLRSLAVGPNMSTGLEDWQRRTAKVVAYRACLPTLLLLPRLHAAGPHIRRGASKDSALVSIEASGRMGLVVYAVVSLATCSLCCCVIQMTREASG